MRRKCKVFAALLLTLALTVCLALPSWAETRINEGTTGTITLNLDTSDTNVTATAYKVIDVKYYNKDSYEAPEDPEYYWVDDSDATYTSVADWVRTSGQEKYVSYIGNDGSVTSTFNEENEAVDVKEFASEMAAAIRGNTIMGVFSTTGTTSPTDKSIVFNNLEMGTYLILVEGGTRIYSPVFVSLVPTWNKNGNQWQLTPPEDVEVTEKSEALNLTKKVFDVETLDDNPSTYPLGKETENEDVKVQIGDTVTYILEADVPNYPADAINTSYEISDNLPTGMSLNKNSITVYGIVDSTASGTGTSTATTLAPKTNEQDSTGHYTQTVTKAQRHDGSDVSFNLKFDYDKLHTTGAPQTRFDKIRVVYTATANGSIQLVSTNSGKVNVNTAYLDYNNNPYGDADSWESVNDDANVYSYGIKVDKVDQKDSSLYLPGAIFTLKKDGSNDLISFVSLGNGSYRVATSSSENGATTQLHVGEEKVPSDSMKGKLQLSGLDVGTYILTEVQAPAGYHKPSATISVLIQDDGTANGTTALNGKPEYTPQGGIETEATDGYVPVTVTNTKGFTLPSTGGMGTVLFTTFGILLMGAGLVVLVLFLRRRSTK